MPVFKKRWQNHLSVLGLYTLLALFMSWPLLPNISSYVVGEGGDVWQTLWRFEDRYQAGVSQFQAGKLGDFLHTEFFGGGEARLINISVWPWMWLHAAFGEPLAYNLVWLLSCILSGYAMYLLVKYLIASEKHKDGVDSNPSLEFAAFLAGVIYMFLPFRVGHSMGHFGAMQAQWLPFAVLALLSFVRRPNIATALVAALVITLQAWTEHHYTLWLLIFLAASVIYFRKHLRAWLARGWKYFVLLVALIGVFGCLPWLPTVKLALLPSSSLALGESQTVRFSADVASFFVPSPWHPIWGGVMYDLFVKYFTGNIFENTQFLGWLGIMGLLFFHRDIPKLQKRFWLCVLVVFALIALGPRLHVFGQVLPIPLPYAILDSWPVFQVVRAVARAGIMVGLSASVLMGWVFARSIKSWQRAAAAGIVILFEFLFLPVPLQSAQLSRAYEIIQHLPQQAIIELPAATNYAAASRSLYASAKHHKQIVGNIALERAQDQELFEEIRSLPALRQLLYLRSQHLGEGRAEFWQQDLGETLADALRYFDVGAILIHQDSLSPTQTEAAQNFLEGRLGLKPELVDDIILYRVNAPELPASDGVFVARDDGWEHVGFDPRRGSVFAEVSKNAKLTIYNARTTPVPMQFEFYVEQGSFKIGEKILSKGSSTGISTSIPPGKTILTFERIGNDVAILRDPVLHVDLAKSH